MKETLQAWVDWLDIFCSPEGCETIRIDAGMLHDAFLTAVVEMEVLEELNAQYEIGARIAVPDIFIARASELLLPKKEYRNDSWTAQANRLLHDIVEAHAARREADGETSERE